MPHRPIALLLERAAAHALMCQLLGNLESGSELQPQLVTECWQQLFRLRPREPISNPQLGVPCDEPQHIVLTHELAHARCHGPHPGEGGFRLQVPGSMRHGGGAPLLSRLGRVGQPAH